MRSWSTITQPQNVKVYISEEFLNSSLPPLKDAMPALRRRGKLSVLHNLVKENFSILCEVLQLSSVEEIAAKLVKSYISEEFLKLSKYPSKDGKPTPKRRGKFAMNAGFLVGMMGLGTNQNYIGGAGVNPNPFVVLARHAEACLPVPHGYFRFSLAEENSAKIDCFRLIKDLQSASLKMRGKLEMATGLVVAGRLGSYLGLKNRGGDVPSVPSPNPIQLWKSWLNCVLKFSILSKSENNKGCDPS